MSQAKERCTNIFQKGNRCPKILSFSFSAQLQLDSR